MGYSIEWTKHGVFLHTPQFFKKQQLPRLGISMYQTSLSAQACLFRLDPPRR